MYSAKITLFGLSALLMSTTLAEAQVSVNAPFVKVQTGGPGGGVYVKAPFVTVNVPPRYPVYYPVPGQPLPGQPLPGQPLPGGVEPAPGLPQLPQPKPYMPPADQSFVFPPQAQPQGKPVLVSNKAVLTHYDFAKVFVPIPGKHEVTLVHPGSHCAVDVCFTLPPGCPKVRTGHRYLEFDYGKYTVEVRFALFGKVKVYYD